VIIGGQAAVDRYRADMAWAAGALQRGAARQVRMRKLTLAILDHALPVRPAWTMVDPCKSK